MQQSKTSLVTSKRTEIQLPLKGMRVPLGRPESQHSFTLEGMGEGRYRVHVQLKR